MMTLVKIIHVLALGLWSGGMTFFMFFTALPLISELPANVKAAGHWLNRTHGEDGIRLAGESLEIIFARYFPYEVICGLIALGTSLVWFTTEGWVHKLRIGLLVGAVALAVTNWLYLAPTVSQARTERYSADSKVKAQAETTFKTFHGYSLTTDILTLLLAGAGLVLTVWLPAPVKDVVSQ